MKYYDGFRKEFALITRGTEKQLGVQLPKYDIIIGDELYDHQDDSRVKGFINHSSPARYDYNDNLFLFKHHIMNIPQKASLLMVHEIGHMVHKTLGGNQKNRSPVEMIIDEGFSEWFMFTGYKGDFITCEVPSYRSLHKAVSIKDAQKHLTKTGTSEFDSDNPYNRSVAYNVGHLFFEKVVSYGFDPLAILQDPPHTFEQIDKVLLQ